MRLDQEDLDAIAERVAALLVEPRGPVIERWLSTAEVAAAFGRSDEWVRDHAADLGGRKIGGPRAPWRFPAGCVDGRDESPAAAELPPTPKSGPRRGSTVALLPIRG
jgi:hypothetical protein